MPLRMEVGIGKLLILDGYDAEECYPATYGELKKDFVETMAIGLPNDEDLGFVVYGFATPGEEHKGKLWVNLGPQNQFISLFYFAAGRWIDWLQFGNRVHRLIGDSKNPPLGYRALDGSASNLPDLSGEFRGAAPTEIYSAIWIGVSATA